MNIDEHAKKLRIMVLEVLRRSGSGHVATALSCADIIAALYYGNVLRFDPQNPLWPKRDRFLMSKGHAGTVLYCALADLGFFPVEHLWRTGKEDGRMALQTAADKVLLQACTDRYAIRADGSDLAYVMIKLCDEKGVWNRAAKKAVTVAVEGAGTLQGFGNANPFSEGDFFDTTWETWDGAVLAVVRAGKAPGEIAVKVSAEGCEYVAVTVQVK